MYASPIPLGRVVTSCSDQDSSSTLSGLHSPSQSDAVTQQNDFKMIMNPKVSPSLWKRATRMASFRN